MRQMILLKLAEIPGRKKGKKIYISSGKKDRHKLWLDFLLALVSGLLAAGLSVWWGLKQWEITNYRHQQTERNDSGCC